MNFVEKLLITLACALIFLISPPVTSAATLAEQTGDFSSQLNVWQAIQELGSNLSGKAGTFTFRVNTSRTNLNQFDYTAQNSRIYDKTLNTYIGGCVPADSNPNDRLRGLTFTTAGVPAGYEDVSIDFSCRNYEFIPGRRYLIFISNANMGNSGSGQILFAASAYGTNSSLDYFTGGGVRYGNGNPWDYYKNSGSCNPITYVWNDQTINPVSGCNIWTSPRDDLYFILSDTSPPLSKTPLILIPGIGGSELKVSEDTIWNKDDGHGGTFNRAYAKDEKVWVNEAEVIQLGDDDYFDILRMKSDGQTSEANLELTGDLFDGAYQQSISFFTSNGYTLNKDLFIFPYDWRKDITLTASILDAKINQIKSQTGTAKVDIVAHSMGGLVARNYISDSIRAQKIRKLITLGTPHLGAVDFLKNINYGGCLRFEIGPICLSFAPSELKDVIQNMISSFELAPTQAYFNFYTGSDNLPFPFRDDRDIDSNGVTGPLNYDQTKTLLTNLDYNTSLFVPSEVFHNLDNSLPETNEVEVSIIAGSGIPTLGQIIEKYTINFAGIQIPYKDEVKINGDSTVPIFSASLSDPTRSISLAGNAKIYYTKQKHGNLVSDGPALRLTKNILNDDNQTPEGASTQPYQLEGTQLSVHSPVNIHVYDQNNNHTGPTQNGNFETNIPESSYETLDDAKFIWLPEDGQYTVKFESTDQGSFDFKIREFKNDINDQTILYQKIPLTTATKAEAVFDTNTPNPPTLQVDSDGNGEVDSQVNPTVTLTGSSASDQTPPKTIISLTGTEGDNDWFKDNVTIELSSQDEASGSGIAKNEFWFAGTQKIHTFTKPFVISREGTSKLKVKSTDLAGNEELPQEIEIKIDKTSPELKITPDFRNRQFKVVGIDNLSMTQTEATTSGELAITDKAGNITRLKVEQSEGQLSLKSISYKDLLPVTFPGNQFTIVFTGTHQQTINIAGITEVTANYNREENKTYIETKKPDGTTFSETKNGFILLQLLTNKGQLEVKY